MCKHKGLFSAFAHASFLRLFSGKSKPAIADEVHRLAPLVEEGGFIGFCDHRVPPDVPLENYMFYLETARKVWGKNLENLKPMGKLSPVPSSKDA